MSATEDRPAHKLFLSEDRLSDGGVVVMSFQAFCRCGWSMMYASRYRAKAMSAFERHASCGDCTSVCRCMANMTEDGRMVKRDG